MHIRTLTTADIDVLLCLWRQVPGFGLGPDDEPERVAGFLTRNPTTCLGLFIQDRLAGSVLDGYDGRRGYLYHLAVHPSLQGNGYGKDLINGVTEAFLALDAKNMRLFVYADNRRAREFYRRQGWRERGDLVVVGWNMAE